MATNPANDARPSLDELLDEALRLASELDKTLSQLVPGTAQGVAGGIVPAGVGLSVDEKLVRGIEAARRLSALAFHAAPGPVLDALEERLPAHEASRDEAAELLRRLQN